VSSLKNKTQYSGGLYFYSTENLTLLYKIDYHDAVSFCIFIIKHLDFQGCIRALWHPKINQIMVSLSNGIVKNYYDPEISVRGARVCADKPVRRPRTTEIVQEELILSRKFQPLFRVSN
jgi:hypothetical protein